MTTENNTTETAETAASTVNRKMIIASIVIAFAFIGSYAFAQTRSASTASSAQNAAAGDTVATANGTTGADASGAGAGCGGGCCGGGSTTPIEGSTTVENGVQKIAVDTSKGSFDPNTIKAKAGIPIEIEFSQAPGGCMSGVLFKDFGISEDLTGGPKTIKLPALDAGEYVFTCQMEMVTGTLVVE